MLLISLVTAAGLGLNLFKLLIPDSLIPSVGYIPIINKKVSSVLNNVSSLLVDITCKDVVTYCPY